MQAAGGGGGREDAVSPGSVLKVPVQGSQHLLQPDDGVLPEAGGAALPPGAGPPRLRVSLLLGDAGWGTVRPLGLGDVSGRSSVGCSSKAAERSVCCSELLVCVSEVNR